MVGKSNFISHYGEQMLRVEHNGRTDVITGLRWPQNLVCQVVQSRDCYQRHQIVFQRYDHTFCTDHKKI